MTKGKSWLAVRRLLMFPGTSTPNALVGEEGGDLLKVLKNRARQMLAPESLLGQSLDEDELIPPIHPLLQPSRAMVFSSSIASHLSR